MARTLSLVLSGSLFFCSCEVKPSETAGPPPAVAQAGSGPPRSIEIRDFAEPPFLESDSDLNDLKLAWQRFSDNGRYRLARASDMKFSEPAKRRINESFSRWQVGFTFGGEFVALVVDNTRDDDGRFGVVIFRPVHEGGSRTFTPHWIVRERDLSKAALNRVSGYLFVHEFVDGEDYKTCEVKWHQRSSKYLCRPA